MRPPPLHLFALFGLAGLVHFPLLGLDHVLWDEVSFEQMTRTGDYLPKALSLSAQGVGTTYNFYPALGGLPHPLPAVRMLVLSTIFVSATCIYFILRASDRFSRGSAIIGAATFVVFPAYQMYGNVGTATYAICLSLFLGGLHAYVRALTATQRGANWLYLVAAALWTTSYAMQSLIPFTYVAMFAVILIVGWSRIQAAAAAKRSGLQDARIHALLLITPIVYYGACKKLFPLHPYFGDAANGHNVPTFDFQKLTSSYLKALDASVYSPLESIARSPVAWFAGAVAGACMFFFHSNSRFGESAASPRLGGTGSYIAATALLLGGLFPYIAVGKPPSASGVGTRFAILVGPAIAFFSAAIARDLLSSQRSWPRVLLSAGIAAALVGWTLASWESYVDWQICSIKDRAIIRSLQKVPSPSANYVLVDGVDLEHTYDRRFYDWARLFRDAWGGTQRIGLQRGDYPSPTSGIVSPLGIPRDHVQFFREWMGYGPPPDGTLDFVELSIESTASSRMSTWGKWLCVWRDVRRRYFSASSEAAHHSEPLEMVARLGPNRPFPYDSTRLPSLEAIKPVSGFLLSHERHYRAFAENRVATLSVHAATKGRFRTAQHHIGGIRAVFDEPPSDTGARAELLLCLEVKSDHGPNRPRGPWGCSVDAVFSQGEKAPRLYLVLSDGTEIEGAIDRDSRRLEAWVNAPATPVVRGWIIWNPVSAGARLSVLSIRAGQPTL